MVDDGLVDLVGKVNVALTQHALPFPAGQVASRPGTTMSTADSMKVTVYGHGGHGSMPQDSVDPVVLAASIVMRLQTIVARRLRRPSPPWYLSAVSRPAPKATS